MYNATRCRRLTLCVIMLMMMATGCPGNGKKETPRKATKKPAIHTPEKQDPTTDVDQKEEPGGSGGGGGPNPPPNPLDQQLNERIEAVKKSKKPRINALETCLKAVFYITDDSKQITDCATIWATIEDLTCDPGVFKVGIKRIKALRLFLDKKIPKSRIPEKYEDYTCHPLHVAILRALSGTDEAKENYRSVIQLLLRAGDNIESVACKNDIKNTPLHLAVIFNASIETVELLLRERANVNADNNHDKTILMSAVQAGNPTIVQRLIQGKAEVNKAFGGSTPLSMALQTLDSVKLGGSDGKTGTRETYIKIANVLLAAGAKDPGRAIEKLVNTSPIICTDNGEGIKELILDEKSWRRIQEAAQKEKEEAAQKAKAEAEQKSNDETHLETEKKSDSPMHENGPSLNLATESRGQRGYAAMKLEALAGIMWNKVHIEEFDKSSLGDMEALSRSFVEDSNNKDFSDERFIEFISGLETTNGRFVNDNDSRPGAVFKQWDIDSLLKNPDSLVVKTIASRTDKDGEKIKHDLMRHYWEYLKKQNAKTRKEILAKLPWNLLVYGHFGTYGAKDWMIYIGSCTMLPSIVDEVAFALSLRWVKSKYKRKKMLAENIPFTDEDLWRDKKFVLGMVVKYKEAVACNVFQQADDRLKNDLEFVREVCKIDRRALYAATKRVRESISKINSW